MPLAKGDNFSNFQQFKETTNLGHGIGTGSAIHRQEA